MRNITLTVLFFTLSLTDVYSQWMSTNGPAGDVVVKALAAHDSLLLGFSSGCGSFVKHSWNSDWQNFSPLRIREVATSNDTLYVATDSAIGFINLGDPNTRIQNFAAQVTSAIGAGNGFVYAGHSQNGISYSDDDGLTFQTFNTGIPADTVGGTNPTYARPIKDITTTDNYVFCATNRGIFRSDYTHTSWVSKGNGLNIGPYYVFLLKELDGKLYALSRNTLYRSTNNGDQWLALTSNFNLLYDIEKHKDSLYLSTDQGVYKSFNGVQWSPVTTNPYQPHIRRLQSYQNKLVGGSLQGDGFFAQLNGEWEEGNTGISCGKVQSLQQIGDTIFATSNKLYRKTSNKKWENITPVNSDFYSKLSAHGDTLFSKPKMVNGTANNLVYYSVDRGLSWTPFTKPDPSNGSFTQLFSDEGRLYVWTYSKLYYTTNLGQTWVDLQVPQGACLHSYDHIVKMNGKMFFRSCYDQIIGYENGSWQPANSGLAPGVIDVIGKSKSSMFAYLENAGMYVSRDSGRSWQLSTSGLAPNLDFQGFTYRGDTIFLIGSTGEIYASYDDGNHWGKPISGNPPAVRSLLIAGDTLFAGTLNEGVWKRSLADITISLQENKISNNIVEVYPNPAQDYFIINSNAQRPVGSYEIWSMSSQVLLKGEYSDGEPINIKEMGGGTYILRLLSSEGTRSVKLVISR